VVITSESKSPSMPKIEADVAEPDSEPQIDADAASNPTQPLLYPY